jgi:hypothetical protein
VEGFRVEWNDSTRTEVPALGHACRSEMMVVEGLDPHTILGSVRCLRVCDGINSYFNTDNHDGVDNCIRLPDGVYVPFVDQEHHVNFRAHGYGHSAQSLWHSHGRTDIGTHAALMHPGMNRVRYSNITVDGRKLRYDAVVPANCPGCRLGGATTPPISNSRVDRGPIMKRPRGEYFASKLTRA